MDAIGREQVEAFIADQLIRWDAIDRRNPYRSLQQFFRWLVEDGEIAVSPMANLRPPSVPDAPVPVVGDEELPELLAAPPALRLRQRSVRIDLTFERRSGLEGSAAPASIVLDPPRARPCRRPVATDVARSAAAKKTSVSSRTRRRPSCDESEAPHFSLGRWR